MKKVFEWKSPIVENPDPLVWKELCEWAVRLARKVAKGEYQQPFWIDELASAGYRQVHRVWHRYWRLPVHEWRKVMAAVMVFAMLAVIRKENLRTDRIRGPETDSDLCSCMPKHHVAEKDLMEQISTAGELVDMEGSADWVTAGGMADAERRANLEAVYAAAHRNLTPSEFRVMVEVMRFEGSSGEEIAEQLEMTHDSVRAHKTHAINRLKRHFREP